MREPSPADVAIVIPTRHRWPILARTLDALEHQTVDGFETIVVVDGTDEEPPDLARVTVVRQPHAGPGAARNTGVRATDRPIVLLLGDDMVPTPQLVERHVGRHAQELDDRLAVLGRVAWHPDVPDDRLHRWLDWSGTQFDFAGIDGDDAGWGRFYSCNVSLRRSLYLQVGGFDEAFAFDYEDLDAGWRLAQAGMHLVYEPDALARHLHVYDWPRLAARYRSRAAAEQVMARKHAWFEPYFRSRVRDATRHRPVSRAWPVLADAVHAQRGPIARYVRRRADRWYHQRLAPAFLTAWEGERDLEELRAYLGDEYDEQLLFGHEHAVDAEEHAAADETTFYRTSTMYLYDLTAFAMSGTKRPYLRVVRELVSPGTSLLDWGCGIGSDGLRLLDGGYAVEFADFDNPSTRYLRWRLERRALDAPVYDIENDDIPGGFDLAYSFDVIEHVDDPFAFLGELERRGRIVVVNLLAELPGDTHLHRPLPIDAILDHADRRGLVRYRRFHDRVHLVAYRGTARARPLERVRSSVERRAGPAGAQLAGRLRTAFTGATAPGATLHAARRGQTSPTR